MLREISQLKKTTTVGLYFCELPGVVSLTETESRMVTARARGRGQRKFFKGYRSLDFAR